ncbi:short fiber-2 [Simian adenovirus 17]|nr:short fiber-2 [Simian adenovirus 17]
MKRSRIDDDFNPVYPYDAQFNPPSFLTPPFVSSDGFKDSPSGVLSLNINENKGLTISNSQLTVKLEEDLTFSPTGGITLSSATLWTVPTTSANCSVYHNLDSLFMLCLSKSDAMIVGTVYFYGLSSYFQTLPQTSVTVELTFDASGNLTSSPLAANVWGKRQNNSIASVTNGLSFMPHATIYPRGGNASPKNYLYIPTFLRGNPTKGITLTVGLNTNSTAQYSLKFQWSHVRGELFVAPPCTFAYVAQQ